MKCRAISSPLWRNPSTSFSSPFTQSIKCLCHCIESIWQLYKIASKMEFILKLVKHLRILDIITTSCIRTGRMTPSPGDFYGAFDSNTHTILLFTSHIWLHPSSMMACYPYRICWAVWKCGSSRHSITLDSNVASAPGTVVRLSLGLHSMPTASNYALLSSHADSQVPSTV